ncbi:MAG: hypothetical protein PHS92_04515 [Candidatus Gracilibacteria bacterium]|nr:hypothetical protein [Candidatus Gracilibacteria bacterium]
MQKKIFVSIFVMISIIGFYYFGKDINYTKHEEIKASQINHPEFIPTARTVKLSGAGYSNIISDFYWLGAIQYIGSNVIGASYKKYLYEMLNLITDLNPYFTYPYEIGELLLPNYNYRYEKLSNKEIEHNTRQAELLGLKGMKNTCDLKKIELIRNEFNLNKLWTEDRYKNPCLDPNIPYYLAYIYYWNLNDSKNASLYYKVTSANENAPVGARSISAVMEGKTGNRETAIVMFLSLASSVGDEKSKLCNDFSKELGDILFNAFKDKKAFDGKFLSMVESYRLDIIKKLGEEDIDAGLGNADNFCSTYLNKAVREMNMAYIEQSDKRFFVDRKKHANDANELLYSGYIDYLPIDFQKGKNGFGIIYYYNNDISNWDFKMGKY